MFGKGQDIYRSKALDRLSSPDAVDQLLQVVTPRDWIALLAAGILIALLIAWSVTGIIPTTVSGRSVLVQPRTIVDSQNLTAGRLESLNIKAGDAVHTGDVLGVIDQSDTRKALQEDRYMLDELQQQDRIKGMLQDRQTALQEEQIQSERSSIQLQNETLKKSLQDTVTMAPMLKRRLDGLRKLRTEGLIADASADLLQAEDAVLQNETKMTDLNARLKQLEGQSKELELRRAGTARENVEASTVRRNQMDSLNSRMALETLQLSRNGEIRSEHSGRIVEVIARPGQVLTAGARIATIQINDDASLLSISYFNVADGKKIHPGMPVQITPDPVERQRFGGISGVVDSVSDLPVTKEAAILVVGNASTVDVLMPNGPFIQVTAKLQRDPSTFSGYKWSSSAGPPMQLSPGVTASGRVTVEGRAPITYLLPFLRSVSGVY